MKELVDGYHRFRRDLYPTCKDVYAKLASGQQPPVLFITCSDSRVNPELYGQQDPGQLFVIRNAGNIVPTYGADSGSVSATIEYAMRGLRVSSVVICGHTGCGAMGALLHPEDLGDLPEVESWVQQAEAARQVVEARYPAEEEDVRLQKCVETNVLIQIQHLQTHPSVAERLAEGNLTIFGWVFDISTATLHQYNESKREYAPLDNNLYPVTPLFI
ncbi:MAG: carbonic anhydrase [Myxococcales bacterium]|nr:carbonic anhydrase [Myxococcales bacterium]